jgi:hypothetical protein
MPETSFLKEWNERAGFVGAIAVINPIIVTAYVMFWHRGTGGLEFWLIGLGLTFIVCVAAGSFMLLVILTDRRKRAHRQRKQEMWDGVMPYDAVRERAKREAAAEGG